MRSRRHSLLRLVALAVALEGCFLSHGTEPTADAGAPVARRGCELRPSAMSISVTAEALSSEPCDPGPMEGWVLDLVVSDDAFDVLLDSCPPDGDCDRSRRCVLRVEGSEVVPELELGQLVSGWAQPGYLRLNREVSCCRGPGCLCGVPRTLLYARGDNPSAAPPDAPPGRDELTFSRGEITCGDGSCGPRPFELVASVDVPHASSPTTPVAVGPGETRQLGDTGISVHVVASSHDECTDLPASAAWIAWLEESGTGG